MADNCLWKGGDGNFHDKNWLNCGRPGTKDNVKIGNYPYSAGTLYVNQQEEFHDLFINYGSVVNLVAFMFVHGNDFTNSGTLNLTQISDTHPYFRSYSKNLIISTIYGGTINLDNGDLGGNMTIQSGILVRGAGQVGRESDLLFNNGTIKADLPGKEIIFQRAVDGQGTFQSESGGTLHFTADSSGDNLINNGRLQLDGNFVVARDYRGAFTNGNIFDARRNVSGGGQILAADARQVLSGPRLSGNVVDMGAMRVGGQASTTLTVANAGGLTTLRGAVQSGNTALTATNVNFGLTPGASQTSTLTFSGKTSGAYFGQMLNVVNNFDNVADDHLYVRANVYTRAVAAIQNRTVDFGTVRKGSTGVTAAVSIGNTASGGLNDTLSLAFGPTPGKVSPVYLPNSVAAGTSASAVYGLDTAQAGSVGGTSSIALASHNPEMADASLGSQSLSFTGKVTDPAVAQLFLAGGAGQFSGSGTTYTLDLGTLYTKSGAVNTQLALYNAVPYSLFAETLVGSFALTADAGYSFLGGPASGLQAGYADYGNFLTFDTGTLSAGSYHGLLTFDGYSRYAGLGDLKLAQLQLSIDATVLDAPVADVPEPEGWAMLVGGIGLLGCVAGRRRRQARRPGEPVLQGIGHGANRHGIPHIRMRRHRGVVACVGGEYRLADVARARADLESGRTTGRLVPVGREELRPACPHRSG